MVHYRRGCLLQLRLFLVMVYADFKSYLQENYKDMLEDSITALLCTIVNKVDTNLAKKLKIQLKLREVHIAETVLYTISHHIQA